MHKQEISCLHRIRERPIKNKTAVNNQIRGLLSKFGVVLPCGHAAFIAGLYSFLDNSQYSHRLQNMMSDMLNEYIAIGVQLKHSEQ